MDKQKWGILLLVVATLAFIKFAFFPMDNAKQDAEETNQEELQTEEVKPPVRKVYVNVFFIAQNDKKEEVYRAVKRLYDEETDGSQLRFAINNLLKGPTASEKTKGVYTEVPSSTRLISLKETPERIDINLSDDFSNGGGTEGVYKRLYQLIKTANKNANAPVYLLINGTQAEVIGGDGIMLTQPLNERSLDE